MLYSNIAVYLQNDCGNCDAINYVKNNVTYFPLYTTGRIKNDAYPSRKGCILHNCAEVVK